MTNEFYHKGHHYKVVQIEGSTDYSIIKDGRQSKRISKEIAVEAVSNVDKLF